MLYFVHTIEPREFLRWLRVADLRQPPHVAFCPRLQPQRWTLPCTQPHFLRGISHNSTLRRR